MNIVEFKAEKASIFRNILIALPRLVRHSGRQSTYRPTS